MRSIRNITITFYALLCCGSVSFGQSNGIPDTNINKSLFLIPVDFYRKALNLKVSSYRNGDPIKRVYSLEEFCRSHYGIGKFYIDLSDSTYYYNWHAVHDHRGLAPVGYKILTSSQLPNYNIDKGSKKSIQGLSLCNLSNGDISFWVYDPIKIDEQNGSYVIFNSQTKKYLTSASDINMTGLTVVCVENIGEQLNEFSYDVLLPDAFKRLKDSLSSIVLTKDDFFGHSKSWTASFDATLRFSNTGLNESSSVFRKECSTADFEDMKSMQRLFSDFISNWKYYPLHNSNPVETEVDLNFIVSSYHQRRQSRQQYRFLSEFQKNRNLFIDELSSNLLHDKVLNVSTIQVRLEKADSSQHQEDCNAFGGSGHNTGNSNQICFLSSIHYPTGSNAFLSVIPGLGSMITDKSARRKKWVLYVGTGIMAGALATFSYMKRNEFYNQYRGGDFADESLYDKANFYNKTFLSLGGLYVGMSVYDLLNTLRLGRRNRKHYANLQEQIKSQPGRIMLIRNE